MGRRRLALLLACLGLLLLAIGSAGASTPTPVNGRLLIATGSHADASLDGLDLRTGDRLHLVPFGGTVRGVYSPNGTKIAFHTNYDGDYEICVVNADGTGQMNLTNDLPGQEEAPHWSPDGQRNAFSANMYGSWEV